MTRIQILAALSFGIVMMAGNPAFCAEVKSKATQKLVLKRYGFAAPPDLSAFGLKKAGEVYVKADAREATEKELVAALESLRSRGDAGKTKSASVTPAVLTGALSAGGPDFDNSSKAVSSQKDLVAMVDSGDPQVRAKAIASLGDLKNEKLAPLFMHKMNDPEAKVRDAAARAIGGLLALNKKDSQEGDWRPYMKASPPLLSALALSPDQVDPGRETGKVLYENISYGNLISDSEVTRMVRGMDDPRVLMIMMGANDASLVGQWTGMHAVDGVAYFTRIKILTNGRVSRLFSDPAIKTMTKVTVLARLVNYRILEDALRNDSEMNRLLPSLLFEPEGLQNNWIRSNEIWTIDDIARRVYGAGFYRNIIDRLPTLTEGGRKAALAFLNAHPARLSAAQRAAISASAAPQQKDPGTTVYAQWPKDRLDVSLFMTKSLHYVDSMLNSLDKAGYKVKSDQKLKTRKLELTRSGAVEIRLHMEVFDSSEENDWWALDHQALTDAIAKAMKDPKQQAVIFRGHAGDYDVFQIAKVKSDGKVFADLSCYSDFRSEIAIRSCENCDYFGTVGTSNGWNNDFLLPKLIADLADKEDPEEMLASYKRQLPAGEYYLAGSATQAGRWKKQR